MKLIEMAIDSVRVNPQNQKVVILKEKDGERYLPIWISDHGAESIQVCIDGLKPLRPLTHDVMLDIIHTVGFRVENVIMNDLASDTHYAKITLSNNSEIYEIDSRPSDALALAIRASSPIYADEDVMKKASIVLDSDKPQQ